MNHRPRAALLSSMFVLASLASGSSAAVAAPSLQPAQVKAGMAARLKATKKKADPAKLASIFVMAGTPQMKTKSGKTVVLEPVNETGPTRPASAEPAEVSKYKAYYDAPTAEPTKGTPVAIASFRDHTEQQTSVKDQMSRGTCMAFATVATMESNLKRQKNLTANISEEHFYKLVKDSVQKNCNSDGTTFPGILNALSGKRVCSESELPYAAPSNCEVPPVCSANASYSIERPIFIPRAPETSGSAFWAGNARLIEAFIDLGYDVAFGFLIAGTGWHDDADSGIIDVQLKGDGTPVDPHASHGVALVGYNRSGGYFILKNSWGTDWGRGGYARISYDYVQTYAKDAIVILETGKADPARVQMQPTSKPVVKAQSGIAR